MTRPIEYVREEALDKALLAFWRMGHAACSFQVLVDATGMNRQSIYNTFGDKNAFFRSVVEHYKSKVIQQCQHLKKPDANQESLYVFMKESLAFQKGVGPGACFIVITAFSPQANDPMIKPALDEGAKIVRGAFAAVLSNEQKNGNLTLSATPEDAADYLYCVMNGLSALAQTGGAETQIDIALNLAFQALNSNKET